ncbi:MAG: lytic transglycosylase domain-containing protein [Burkholderiales bacterium]
MSRKWCIAGFALGIALHAAVTASPIAEVYEVGDGVEVIHLSNRTQTPAVQPNRSAGREASHTSAVLTRLIDQAALAHRVEPQLLHALIDVESGFAVRAVSSRGALGLMQLMPGTARDYGVTDAFDPRQNIEAGAQHLRRMLDRFGQDKALALAAYNAGPEAVTRHHGRIPPYAETMAYVPRVLQRFALLQRDAR